MPESRRLTVQTLAVGYIRRSQESTERTVSLEVQAEAIRAECLRQGWTLAALISHDRVSGGKRARFAELWRRLHGTHATVLVVYHHDRLARDLGGILDFAAKCDRAGIQLWVAGQGPIERRSSAGYLVTAVNGMVAEHYRLLVGEKTRAALAHRRAAGHRWWGGGCAGQPPYGLRLTPSGTVDLDPQEQATLRRIAELAQHRPASLRALSQTLAAEGLVARGGRPFAPSTLQRLVRRRNLQRRDANGQEMTDLPVLLLGGATKPE